MQIKTAPYIASGAQMTDSRSSLENVWLLEFDAEGANVLADKLSEVKTDKSFSQDVIAGKNMKFVIVANAGSATFTKGAFTYGQFADMAYEGTMNSAADIPLAGSIDADITEAGQKLDVISVSRIAAVVSFKFTSGADYNFTSFQLRNVPSKVYYVSKGDNSAWTSDKFVDLAAIAVDDQTHTYIVAENCQGTVEGIADPKDKVTDKCAMYVEVLAAKESEDVATSAAFKFFFGDNATTNFDVVRNKEYTADMSVDFNDKADKRISTEEVPKTHPAGAANCYMIAPDKAACLGIPVSRANDFWGSPEGGSTLANVIADGENGGKVTKWKARVIWADTTEDLISLAADSGTSADDYISVKALGKEGNAVVGIFDATAGEPVQDAKPLWSWHIWVTDYNPGGGLNGDIPNIDDNPGQAQVAGGKVFRVIGISSPEDSANKPAMMDRNLGALSAAPKDGIKTIGAFYQWGRKDPFIMPQGIAEPGKFEVDGKTAGPVSKADAVQNPTVFINNSDDWLTTEDLGLWQKPGTLADKSKTIYDPCPEGWRVCTTSSFLDRDKSLSNTSTAPKSEDGHSLEGLILYGGSKGLDIYFAVSGYLSYSGKISSFNTNAQFWTTLAVENSKKSRFTRIIKHEFAEDDYLDSAIFPNQSVVRGVASSVRCVKE